MQLNWNPPTYQSIVATWTWGNEDVDYAVDVHEGATYVGGGRSIARPFTKSALDRNAPLIRLYANFYRESGDVAIAFEKFVEHLNDEFQDVIENHQWGIASDNEKQFRPGMPTWNTISDSGALARSQQMEISVQ